jgi:hypothetical protein
MGDTLSKTIRNSEQDSSLPISINDTDPERGGSVMSASSRDFDEPAAAASNGGDGGDDDDDDPLHVNLDKVLFFVPHVEELYTEKNGDRASVFRVRNYVLSDVMPQHEEEDNATNKWEARKIKFSNEVVGSSINAEDGSTTIFFIDPSDYHTTCWLNAFALKFSTVFSLASVLIAIHRNFENESQDPLNVSDVNVDPEEIAALESTLRAQSSSSDAVGSHDSDYGVSDAVAAASLSSTLPPTIEVHKKFDDILNSPSTNAPDPPPLPLQQNHQYILSNRNSKPINKLLAKNLQVFSYLIKKTSDFIMLSESDVKFFLFWACSDHYQISRINTSAECLDAAYKEIEKAQQAVRAAKQTMSTMTSKTRH